MKRFDKVLLRIFSPSAVLTVSMAIICSVALMYIFISERQETLEAYLVYAMSTYSLTTLAMAIPKSTAKAKSIIYGNVIGNRYLTDMPFRLKVSLYSTLFFNLLYAIIKLLAGIYYASFWYGADALYFVILSGARFLLLHHVQKNEHDSRAEYRKYRFCGYLLFALNAAFIGLIYQVVNQDMGFQYSGLLIYLVATYAFICLAIAITNAIKYNKMNNPILSSVTAISLTRALVAMFSLQTAMFASFAGNENRHFQCVMNSVFGGCICFVIFCMAVAMVVRANRSLRKISINNSETKP